MKFDFPSMPELPDVTRNPQLWEGVDGPSLLAAASVLQLFPENSSWILELQRLSAVAAGLPALSNAQSLSTSKFKKLLSSESVGDASVVKLKDSYEGLFTFEIPFFGGPKLSVQGSATRAGYTADFLLTAIFRTPKDEISETFVLKVRSIANLLLNISDKVCKEFGLSRLSDANEKERRVHVPSAKKLTKLSQLVQFDEEEIFTGFFDLEREYLMAGLVREQGKSAPSQGEASEWSAVQPLVRSRGRIILASPLELTVALRHQIIRAAIEENCVEQLISAMLSLAIDKARELLGFLVDDDFEIISQGRGWACLQAPFDLDKLMEVILIVDDLDGYDPFSAYGRWNADEVFEKIETSLKKSITDDRVFRVYIPTIIGRDLAVELNSARQESGCGDSPVLFATWDDLQTILQTPELSKLGLWYFARAMHRFHRHAGIISFSAVDTFSVYYESGMGFNLGDTSISSNLVIESGYGQSLRVENARRFDLRYFIYPDNGCYVPAQSLYGKESSFPVYLAKGEFGGAYILDLETTIAWVCMPRQAEENGVISVQIRMVFAEALAYWIWQLSLVDPSLIEQAADARGIIKIKIRDVAYEPGLEPWIHANRENSDFLFEVSRNWEPVGRENQIDRMLLAELCRVFGGVDDDIVDRIAPVGPKGMIHIDDAYSMSSWSNDKEPAWGLSKEAICEIQDELREYLVNELSLPAGPIPDDQRVDFLSKSIVRWYIARFSSAVAELTNAALIEQVIERNEAIVAELERDSKLLASRLACFGNSNDEVENVKQRISQSNGSMLASRFVVEFISAFPPSGGKVLNRERYERLLALSFEIIEKGMLVDSLRGELSNVHLTILRSGRLKITREDDSYSRALEEFAQFRARSVVLNALDPAENRLVNSSEFTHCNQAAVEHFGFTYDDISQCVKLLLTLFKGKEVVTISRKTLRRLLADELGWEECKIDSFTGSLELSPCLDINDFWDRKFDVFPWRFNKDRSYLKRPLVQYGDELVFGRRGLIHAPAYWVEQYRSGRLRAKGKMASALSRRRDEKGKNFEVRVANLLREIGYAPVRVEVRRIGVHDFRNISGKNLGDIDVIGVSSDRREVLLVEAKSLEVARTPAEQFNEIKQLIGAENSAMNRLQKRVDWVILHLNSVLNEFHLDGDIEWTVRGVVVVDEPLISEFLINERFPIVSIGRLKDFLVLSGNN